MGTWQAVVMKERGFSVVRSAMTRKGSFPSADYGAACACCNAATDEVMDFDPSAQHRATPIAIPRCKACRMHLVPGNRAATVSIVLGCLAMLGFALGVKNGAVYYVLGALCTACLLAYWLSTVTNRATMHKQGHHLGIEVVALPGMVSVRTTNPTFAATLRERNAELIGDRRAGSGGAVGGGPES
jgi:hypothetical protein